MMEISSNDAGYLEQVFDFFADTSDVYELPHSLADFRDFVSLTQRLSRIYNRSNLFGVYSYDALKGVWVIRYFGASSSRPFKERLRFLAFTEADPEGSLLRSQVQMNRVNATLTLNTVAGIKMTRVTPSEKRLEFLSRVIIHFGTDKAWNV